MRLTVNRQMAKKSTVNRRKRVQSTERVILQFMCVGCWAGSADESQ